MKQFKFVEDYGEYKKGKVIDMDIGIYHKFIHPLLVKGVLKVIKSDNIIREKVKQEVNALPEGLVSALIKLKMGKLRTLGTGYGAKDTSKEELVEEIIEKVPHDIIKAFLERNAQEDN